MDMAELGAGGGQHDYAQQHELEFAGTEQVGQLMALCANKLQGEPQLLSSVLHMLTAVINDHTRSINLEESSSLFDVADLEDMPLEKLVPALANIVEKAKQQQRAEVGDRDQSRAAATSAKRRADGLPKRIVCGCVEKPRSN